MELTNLNLYPIAVLGILISQVLDVYSSGIKFSEFKAAKWADDNAWQLIAAFLCMTAIILLGEPLATILVGTEFKLNPLSIFFLGLGSDALTNYFARRKHNLEKKPSNQ